MSFSLDFFLSSPIIWTRIIFSVYPSQWLSSIGEQVLWLCSVRCMSLCYTHLNRSQPYLKFHINFLPPLLLAAKSEYWLFAGDNDDDDDNDDVDGGIVVVAVTNIIIIIIIIIILWRWMNWKKKKSKNGFNRANIYSSMYLEPTLVMDGPHDLTS